MVHVVVEALEIEALDFYVRRSPVPNAYTLAINGKKAICCCSYKPCGASFKKGGVWFLLIIIVLDSFLLFLF